MLRLGVLVGRATQKCERGRILSLSTTAGRMRGGGVLSYKTDTKGSSYDMPSFGITANEDDLCYAKCSLCHSEKGQMAIWLKLFDEITFWHNLTSLAVIR